MKTRSEAQKEAARRNGAKSRGPVTAEGKARSSRNAHKHGMYETALDLQIHDLEAFHRFAEPYLRQHPTADPAQVALVMSAVTLRWQTRLVQLAYTETWNAEIARQRAASVDPAPAERDLLYMAWSALSGHGSFFRKLETAEHRLQAAEREAWRRVDRYRAQSTGTDDGRAMVASATAPPSVTKVDGTNPANRGSDPTATVARLVPTTDSGGRQTGTPDTPPDAAWGQGLAQPDTSSQKLAQHARAVVSAEKTAPARSSSQPGTDPARPTTKPGPAPRVGTSPGVSLTVPHRSPTIEVVHVCRERGSVS